VNSLKSFTLVSKIIGVMIAKIVGKKNTSVWYKFTGHWQLWQKVLGPGYISEV